MKVTTQQPDNVPRDKLWLLCVVLLFASFSSNAQVVNDGATRTLANVTNTFPGNVTVSTNGAFTLLVISNNALLTNSGFSEIGRNATAKSNEVRLVSPTGRWLMGSHLLVGTAGSFNRLVVSNGAKVFNEVGLLSGNASASNNFALVTGAGSTWSNRSSLNVANSGAGNNRLMIEAGGRVFNVSSLLGGSVASSNNVAVVTGNGSLWKNLGDLSAGYNGSYNTLVVSNGGVVISSNATAGTFGDSRFNQIAVTGSGSAWSNQAAFRLGDFAGGNGLLVNGGATLHVGSYAMIGHQVGAHSNSVRVSDSGSRWLIGTDLYVGSNSPFNRLTISNGGLVAGGKGVIGQTSLSRSNEVAITGAGSLWSNRLDMAIGAAGPFNRLVVSDGGRIVSHNGFVGNEAGNCEAILTGAGSTWSNRADFFMGIHSAGNRLVVSNAARVVNSNALLGFNAGALGNLALATDPGSLWSIRGDLVIGHLGPGNRLEVRSGALVTTDGGAALGSSAAANFNTALVTDPGSRWSVANQLLVGSNSAFNSLLVRNSGQVVSSNGILGFQASANNNTAIVTGAGSVWNNADNFHVGYNGAGNQLILSNGAVVLDRIGEIGGSLGNSNMAVVTGAGSVWSNSQFVIGRLGSGNRLLVSNGGRVESPSAILSANLSSSNSTALVTDSGSSWNASSSLVVGGSSVGNRLVISNGAWARAGAGTIGFASNGSNNEAVVIGPGSTWTNQSLSVGGAGPRNRLVVTNGGLVSASETIVVGFFPSSTNNRVVVDAGTLLVTNAAGTGVLDVRRGTNVLNSGLVDVDVLLLTNAQGRFEFKGGTLITRRADIRNNAPFTIGNAGNVPAVWDVRAGASNYFLAESVVVGVAASFAQLIHTNGALLTNDGLAALGVQAASRSNSVTLGGPTSRWLLSDGMVVGESGSGNRLMVRDGALLVTTRQSYLGQGSASTNNEAVVTGPGSAWLGDDSLYVGADGSFNRLLVRNGGRLTSGLGTLGANPGADGNLALITDASSVWNNRLSLFVGDSGAVNQLVVSNGAAVFGYEGLIGYSSSSSNNLAVVTGAGSLWSNEVDLFVGNDGRNNQLLVSAAGSVLGEVGTVGLSASSSNNLAVLTGSGSTWSNTSALNVGVDGARNQLVVSNGALVVNSNGTIGLFAPGAGNVALVSGAGSLWSNAGDLLVGRAGPGNRLVVSNSGAVFVGSGLTLGSISTSTNNRVVIEGGTLRSTNSSGTSRYDIRRGTNVLNAGLIEADQLLLTNTLGQFEFNGGTLSIGHSSFANGLPFRVGNGVSAATLQLTGDGSHAFSNGGVFVSSNAVLTGGGTASGAVRIQAGALLSPGEGIGRLNLLRLLPPQLLGTTLMEISNAGGALTNDVLQVPATMFYSGSLIVSNAGPDVLTAGNRFRLFVATAYSGSFTNLDLPPLSPGLTWRNDLTADGSIIVVAVLSPGFSAIHQSGTNLILAGTNGTPNTSFTVLAATNVALPLGNWVSIATNQFDPFGGFSFTNAIVPQIPQRFFQLEVR